MSKERDKVQAFLDAVETATEVVYNKVNVFLDELREQVDKVDEQRNAGTGDSHYPSVEQMIDDAARNAESRFTNPDRKSSWRAADPAIFSEGPQLKSLREFWDRLPNEFKTKVNKPNVKAPTSGLLNDLGRLRK